MLFYRAALDLSSSTLRFLSGELAGYRQRIGCRWRRLPPGRQALLVLAHLRRGETFAALGAGFAVGAATAWRYVREAVELLAGLAAPLPVLLARLAVPFLVLDGTLVATNRIPHRIFYSGKHRRHGVNIQALVDPAGRPVWTSPGLPGRAHDLTAARTHGMLDAITQAGIVVLADKGYQGGSPPLTLPVKAHYLRPPLTPVQHAANRAHAARRAPGERGFAVLKTWRILRRVRCRPAHVGTLVAAICVLEQHRG